MTLLKEIFRWIDLNLSKNIKTKLLFPSITLILSSCFFMKPTDPEQVKKDVIAYLEKTYKKKFGVEKVEWACNEGNGCPDGHIVRCFLVENPDLRFRVDIVYDRFNKKEIDIQRDEYLEEELNEQANQDLQKIIDQKFSSYLSNVSVLANPITQIVKYNPDSIDYKKMIYDDPGSININVSLYLLENDSTKKKDYLELSKKIITYFDSLPVNDLALYIYFYNENKYKSMSKEEIKRFFRQFDGVAYKDEDNCERKWAMAFNKEKFPTIESATSNLESHIHEYNINFKK